ncbi:hypothetical protein KPH14_003990 [Odynerus spinipes]|uniref:Uncharacterized protein n=1 Tax=Odynerus spinipes TaxID=1348599 RepID=A0AAD9RY09_9HYME|nr:hypothetical protein KPH14_003990 [Odynerus spinipes]
MVALKLDLIQKYLVSSMNKSVENLLMSSHDVINSINSSNLGHQSCATNVGNGVSSEPPQETINSGGGSPISSPNLSPRPSPRAHNRREYARLNSDSSKESSRANKSDDQSQEAINKSSDSVDYSKNSIHEGKKESRSGDRNKKKSSWYHVLYPTYKSRSEDFKRIFKDVPDDERLVVALSVIHTNYVNCRTFIEES